MRLMNVRYKRKQKIVYILMSQFFLHFSALSLTLFNLFDNPTHLDRERESCHDKTQLNFLPWHFMASSDQ